MLVFLILSCLRFHVESLHEVLVLGNAHGIRWVSLPWASSFRSDESDLYDLSEFMCICLLTANIFRSHLFSSLYYTYKMWRASNTKLVTSNNKIPPWTWFNFCYLADQSSLWRLPSLYYYIIRYPPYYLLRYSSLRIQQYPSDYLLRYSFPRIQQLPSIGLSSRILPSWVSTASHIVKLIIMFSISPSRVSPLDFRPRRSHSNVINNEWPYLGAHQYSSHFTTLAFSALSSLSSLVPNIPIACTLFTPDLSWSLFLFTFQHYRHFGRLT